MEFEARRFYERAMARTSDAGIRKLLGDLGRRRALATSLWRNGSAPSTSRRDAKQAEEETRRRMFVLQVVQPGLAGLMDGSVSTLAPLFAAAFATHDTWQTFLVGMAASVGAGISMGFAEALSDDGELTGRGHPWLRGAITGLMTTHRRHRPHAALPDRRFHDRRPRWRSSWCWSSYGRSPGSGRAYMDTSSCAPPSRWWSAASSSSLPAS